jgi:hypothetical protein
MKPAATWMDPAAIALSGLCLVHCLALPALSLALPLLGVWARAEWVHLVVIILAAPLAMLALRARAARGYLGLALTGLGLMIVAVVAPLSHPGELMLNSGGGLLLATAHTLNLRRRHGQRRAAD